MNYHTVSTSKSGHGAIFTNEKEARSYQADHPGSVYQVFKGRLPAKIPPMGSDPAPVAGDENGAPPPPTGEIHIYTDGSALGNPGPGGYGVIILKEKNTIELSRGYRHTTNNRMEMMAVITALEALSRSDQARRVVIHSDSQYTINGIVKGWARNWRRKGWKKSDGKPALNPDLWKRMLEVVAPFSDLNFKWVRGHAGDPLNERADDLANKAAQGQAGMPMRIDEGYGKKPAPEPSLF